MSRDFTYPEGATPLTNDELHDLIPRHVSSQSELNAVEQMNVAKAIMQLSRKKISHKDILDEGFVRRLHKNLFGEVWKWAGKYRKSDKNIGVSWLEIPIHLKKLLGDVKYQIEFKSYSIDEIAMRFHHRLVQVHPFPNGNGRHSRIITDFLLTSLGSQGFSWGGFSLTDYSKQTAVRKKYIRALREADKGSIDSLMNFAREK